MGLLGSVLGVGLKAVGSAIGAKSQKKAAKRAVAAVTDYAGQSNALATQQYTPYTQAGSAAMTQGNALLGLGGQEAATNAFNTFQQSPGYQFRLNEGLDAVNSGYAGAGVLQSGAAMRGINDYAQNFASNEFNNYFGRLQNQAQLGLGATNSMVGTVSANNAMIGDAAANGALIRGNSNPFAAALGQVSGAMQGGAFNNLFGMKF